MSNNEIISCYHSSLSQASMAPLKNYAQKELGVAYKEIDFKDLSDISTKLRDARNVLLLEFKDDQETLDFLEKGLSHVACPVILMANFQNLDKEMWVLREISRKNKNIFALINTSLDVEFHFPLIRTALRSGKLESHSEEVKTLTEKLNSMVSVTLGELQRVKKLHEQVVPLRSEKLKALSIQSKFAAGESSGGEFFDVIKTENHFTLLLTSSRSYVASSVILSHFETLKIQKKVNDSLVEEFITNVSRELKDLGVIKENNQEDVELMILNFDLNSLKVRGYNFGLAEVTSTEKSAVHERKIPLNEHFLEKAQVSFNLSRDEKVIILSSGLRRNCRDQVQDIDVRDYAKDQIKYGGKKFLNEIFYQLKKDVQGEFLKYDASCITIEVDKNAILKV